LQRLKTLNSPEKGKSNEKKIKEAMKIEDIETGTKVPLHKREEMKMDDTLGLGLN